MARPRKLSDDEMIKIVDSFFENSGDPDMLKCSFLEEYAISQGYGVKAYDFRRNTAVRERMNELKDLSLLPSAEGAIAYKDIDVDSFINRNRTKAMLRNSLLELDNMWRKIYERAAKLANKNKSLKAEIVKIASECEKSDNKITEMSADVELLKRENKNIMLENRYLKRMLKKHLYPAIANEILKQENVLEQVDTVVTQTAMDKMADTASPVSFSGATAPDRQMLSHEEELLNRMRNQIHGGEDGA